MAPGSKSKRGSAKSAQGSVRKKSRKDDEELDAADDVFLYEDEQKAKPAGSDSEEEEVEETAEQKRLRLAKAYLDDLRAAAEDGDDGVGPLGVGVDALTERLRQDAAEVHGRLQRRIAHRVSLPAAEPSTSGRAAAGGAPLGPGAIFKRAHRLTPTALALSADDTTAWSVSKDGSIFRWDVETMAKTRLSRPGDQQAGTGSEQRRADWVKPTARQGGGRASLLAAAVSSDGALLAVGGGDQRVHVFDARSGEHVQAYPGHRDVVSGLAFREGTHTLLSGSFDRTVKLWSLDDGAYMDTLYGHQAEVLAVDAARAERALSAGHDRSCRVWKIPEESQLVFRAPDLALDCCRYITATEWLSGANDGSLQLWSAVKKKPVAVVRGAHGAGSKPHAHQQQQQHQGAEEGAGPEELAAGAAAAAAAAAVGAAAAPPERGSWAVAGSSATSWVQSVAVSRGADLAASGAGDGVVRLWRVTEGKSGGAGGLEAVADVPAPGFANGLALAHSGRFMMAALGQEPRLGRWAQVGGARNGVLLQPLPLGPAEGRDDDEQ